MHQDCSPLDIAVCCLVLLGFLSIRFGCRSVSVDYSQAGLGRLLSGVQAYGFILLSQLLQFLFSYNYD